MPALLVGSLLGAFWFSVFVLGHVGLFHLRFVHNRSRAILSIFICAVVADVLSALVLIAAAPGSANDGQPFAILMAGPLIMLCGFVLYMPLYYTITTSVSIQTLIAIEQAAGGGCDLSELKSARVYEQLLRGRLESMLAAGNLIRDGTAYRLTHKGRQIARIFGALKQLWRLGPGG
jgi:hypothetical protein